MPKYQDPCTEIEPKRAKNVILHSFYFISAHVFIKVPKNT